MGNKFPVTGANTADLLQWQLLTKRETCERNTLIEKSILSPKMRKQGQNVGAESESTDNDSRNCGSWKNCDKRD